MATKKANLALDLTTDDLRLIKDCVNGMAAHAGFTGTMYANDFVVGIRWDDEECQHFITSIEATA